MIEEIARATAELDLDLVDWVKLYLIVLIAGSILAAISAAIANEITNRTDKHSKSRNKENERNILQDKDNDKN